MSDRPPRKITARIIRKGQEEPIDQDWRDMTVEQRIMAVWELTRVCHAFAGGDPSELRLQRAVVHVQRVRRRVPGELIEQKNGKRRPKRRPQAD